MLVVDRSVRRAEVATFTRQARRLIERNDAPDVVCDVAAVTDPDCAAVDALARLQLTARRLGRQLQIRGVSRELHELLALAGLCELLEVSPTTP